jgi:MscS family membrane protein
MYDCPLLRQVLATPLPRHLSNCHCLLILWVLPLRMDVCWDFCELQRQKITRGLSSTSMASGPRSKARELAGQLKYLWDQELSTSIDDLSRLPNGNTEDQLRLSRESIGTVKLPNGDLKVMLDLVKRSGEPSVWLFSQETLNLVPSAYANIHHTDFEHLFPMWITRIHFLSVPLWRWGIILFSLLVIFGIASLFTRAVLWLLHNILEETLSIGVEASILELKTPFFCLTVAILDRLVGGYAITALGRHYWKSAGFVLAWISAAWLLLRMQAERVTFVTLLGRLFKILVGLVLIIVLLTHAGVNVSALVAGLGIGGIALALAAQKTLAIYLADFRS